LPVVSSISELYASANQQAITAYLGVKGEKERKKEKRDIEGVN
jgi:hypothetical protein